MRLCIDPSTIGQIAISLLVEHHMYSETFVSEPQDMLAHIVQFLDQYEIRPDQILDIEVVMKGGTFTSVRTATTIANMFHLALGVPLGGEASYLSPSYAGEPRL